MTILKDILSTARAALAALPTSRDPSVNFLEHTTNEPFRSAPVGGADGFEVTSKERSQTAGFGVFGWREWTVTMVVTLGHAPYAVDRDRENIVAEDIERVVDVLESRTTWPMGTMLVLSTSANTDKPMGNWWYTEIEFTVVFVGALRS